MGSGDWFKNIIKSKKVKNKKSKTVQESPAPEAEKLNGFKQQHNSKKESGNLINGASNGYPGDLGLPIEDRAATRIQAAFRAYMARKASRHLKGMVRLQMLIKGVSVRKQASTTLSYLYSWSRIQAQISARRICMVTEGQIRQRKLENQLKLEAKLHDVEVEWNGGSETKEEVLAKIHQREDAAVKRERALAYAYSHQWRANANPNFGPGNYELGKSNWGWSWMDRWIAARPWESRVPIQSSPKKSHSRQPSKTGKNIKSSPVKTSSSVKSFSPSGKQSTKGRKLSFTESEKPSPKEGNSIAEEVKAKKEQSI